VGRRGPAHQPAPRPDRKTFTFRRTFTLGNAPPVDPDDPRATIVPGETHTFEWKWPPDQEPSASSDEPATYYEALSGRPDPMRDFFVRGRRALNLVVTLTALAIPIGLVTLAIVSGQQLETIVFAGIAGAIVGLMIKTTFPKTPFG
jgi:hypothetical protein